MSRIRAFCLSFFLTVGILIPLIGCILLLQSHQIQKEQEQQVQQATAGASGVPIALPTPKDRICSLVVIQQQETNHYMLLEVNAVKNRISAIGIPSNTLVLSPQGGTGTLDEECIKAGPGRAAELLSQTLQIEIPYYILGQSSQIAKSASKFGAVSVNLSDYTIPGIKADVGKAPVCMMVPEQVFPLLEEWKLDSLSQANLLANISGEFILSAIQQDSTLLAELLRQSSSKLLTNLTSTEFLQIDRICKLMNGKEPEFIPQILPGKLVSTGFELNENTLTLAKELFQPLPDSSANSAPTEQNEDSPTDEADSADSLSNDSQATHSSDDPSIPENEFFPESEASSNSISSSSEKNESSSFSKTLTS